MQSDSQLLQEYVGNKDQAAFAEIVARHVNVVYGIAVRHLGGPNRGAEDVVQAVFLLLSQKAHRIRRPQALAAWLFQTTRYCCKQAKNDAARRKRNEQEAAMTRTESTPTDPLQTEDLRALLDDALSRLGEKERLAILVRYLEGKTAQQTSAVLGVSAAAVEKRLERGLAKLRQVFARKGFVVPAAGVAAVMLAESAKAAPAGAAASAAGVSGNASVAAVSIAKGAAAMMKMQVVKMAALAAGLALLLMLSASAVVIERARADSAGKAGQTQEPAESTGPKIAPDERAEYKDFPYPKGWPILLPGAVHCTPVVADFKGDGKLAVIVSCAPPRNRDKVLHPTPNDDAWLYAIDTDAKALPGWPLAMDSVGSGPWASSPSVFKRAGQDSLIMVSAEYKTMCISDGGVVKDMGDRSSIVGNVPLVDLMGRGEMDAITEFTVRTMDGKEAPGWDVRFERGHCPCVGDLLGDGKMKIFRLNVTLAGTDEVELHGFDEHGKELDGWPRLIDDPSWFPPVMGDITGDGKMKIVAAYGSHLFAWDASGKGLPNTTTDGDFTGILKSDIFAATASPSLADLDGDGKAEIILFDQQMMAIRAWHGDGKPFGADKDGVIAKLPMSCDGVSVVSLGDDGSMDFFAGTYWVRRSPDGKTKVTNMIPGKGTMLRTQPTVVDLYGDGKAEVIFGLTDGRVFIYKTGLACHPEKMQWPTAQGSFQHTGAWKAPKPAK